MKTIEVQAPQGDVLFTRLTALPADAVRAASPRDRVTVAHSETGHHHEARGTGLEFYTSKDPLICYLRSEVHEIEFVHMRDFATHETQRYAPGILEVCRQREYTPSGFRRVED